MYNQEVNFHYKGVTISIQCSLNERMKDIVEKYCVKEGIDKNRIFCICSGNKLDENIFLVNLMKNKDEKITLLVIDKEDEKKIESMVNSPQIICPECKEMALIKFNNYKLSLNCKNNHDIKNILLKDFEQNQKIDESKIICNQCKINDKSSAFNKEFFICLKCKQNLCSLCKATHAKKNNNHNIIKYSQKNFICFDHEVNYNLYCNTCKKNLCMACENEHSEHDTISFGRLFPNQKELNESMNEFKANIKKLEDEFPKIIEKLKNILENIKNNMNIYLKINNDINNSFDIKSKNYNYELLKNIKEINNNNEILKDINIIINENNIYNKFNHIFNIYAKMNSSENNYKVGENLGNMNNINISFNNSYINNPNMLNNNFNQNNMNINNNYMPNMLNNNNLNPYMSMNNNYLPIQNMMNNMNDNKEERINNGEGVANYYNDYDHSEPKINVYFKTRSGHITTLVINYKKTIDQLLKKYLERIGRLELIGDIGRKVTFIYNARQLKFGDNTPVEQYFKYINDLSITVKFKNIK